jgi:IS1 family transposase
MVGVRTERLELDEAWSFVGKKQKNVKRHEINAKGDQWVFVAMAGTQKAIVSWGVGKRNTESTMDFLHDLRSRVIGQPDISTDGFLPYRPAIRDAFGDSASHGVIVKTYSVTHLAKDAVTRYSPAAVVAVTVSREVVSGDPEQYVSTSYVERQNLSLRMGQRPQRACVRCRRRSRQCRARMVLTRIAPQSEPGHDLRTFECTRCKNVNRYDVEYRPSKPWPLVG